MASVCFKMDNLRAEGPMPCGPDQQVLKGHWARLMQFRRVPIAAQVSYASFGSSASHAAMQAMNELLLTVTTDLKKLLALLLTVEVWRKPVAVLDDKVNIRQVVWKACSQQGQDLFIP